VTGRWIERRELHPDAPRLEELAGPQADDQVTCRRGAAAPGDWSDTGRLWDRFLNGGTRAPAFRLVREGGTLPRSKSTRQASVGSQRIGDLVEPNHVLEHYTNGATVVLQALQFSDPVFAKLSTNLALSLDQPIQVNAYLSPPAARGLDIHFDFHDVVVVQLAGRKRWHVWERIPRSRRPLKRGPAIAQPQPSELGAALLDRVLEPGDCLWLPRGYPHAAETVDEESVHLTIGVMTITWSRLLRDRIDNVASGTALAAAVDANTAGRDEAIAALTGALEPGEIRHAIASDVWRRQPQTRLRPRVAPLLAADERVVVTPGPLLWIGDRTGSGRHTPSLELGDRRLRFPLDCRGFIAGVLGTAGPFRADDVAGDLDVASRRVVLERLAVEGVVARA
jgi:lysine-specific demethylase/histidyl-hydroxylase NO66